MNKYTRLYLNYTKCGPFFNDYMGEFLVSIYNTERASVETQPDARFRP